MHRALAMLLLRMAIGKFPSFESIGNWENFDLLLQANLTKLRAKQLPAEFRVDLLCELIEVSLQEKPEDRCVITSCCFSDSFFCFLPAPVAAAIGIYILYEATYIITLPVLWNFISVF